MGFVHHRDIEKQICVLQGGMLSPKLFTEFLQDLSKSFDQGQGIPVDTLVFSDVLQMLLTALYKYASLWHIIVCIPKQKVLIFKGTGPG